MTSAFGTLLLLILLVLLDISSRGRQGVDAAGERVEQHGDDENGLQKIQQQ